MYGRTAGKRTLLLLFLSFFFAFSNSLLAQELPTRFPILVNGKVGFIDKTGKVVIPPAFSDVTNFSGGVASVQQNGKWGIIDSEGNWVLQPVHEHIGPFSGGMAAYKQNGLWGYLSAGGETAIEARFAYAKNFDQGAAWVKTAGSEKYSLLTKSGKLLLENELEEVTPFSEGLAAVRKGKLYGYINTDGKIAIPFNYYDAQPFVEGMALVFHTGLQYLFIDKKGQTIRSANEYRDLKSYSHGLAVYKQDVRVPVKTGNGKSGFVLKREQSGAINSNGKITINPAYKKLMPCHPELAFAQQENGEWFLINHSDKRIGELAFESVAEFSEDYAPVKINGFISYINTSGEVVIDQSFEKAFPFQNGIARVEKYGKIGYINRKGNFIYFFENFPAEGAARLPGDELALNNYIYKNLKVPYSMDSSMLNRTVFVSAVVEETGKLKEIKIAKGLRDDLDGAALTLVQNMPDWIPALSGHRPYSSNVVIPVRFSRLNYQPVEDLKLLEVKPEFPGGDEKFLSYIISRTTYPKEARSMGYEGTVYIQFVVTEDGKLEEFKVLKEVHELLAEEAMRVLKDMPNWKPGKMNGKFVPVKVAVPVRFYIL